tara:strand:- start:193 stop:525 length:333 start_codon:yes stop_codon:yes gene_type:complete
MEKFTNPAAITRKVNIRPDTVWGDISPYPTVVKVTTVHQRELKTELNLLSSLPVRINSKKYIPAVDAIKKAGIISIKTKRTFMCKYFYAASVYLLSFSFLIVWEKLMLCT